MSRTYAEIEQEILDAKAANAGLDQLNSISKFAIWRLWVSVVALCMYIQEQLWEVYQSELIEYAETKQTHTLRWYRDQVLRFRYGKALIWDGTKFTWPALVGAETVDTLEIVKQAAVVETPGVLQVKAAKVVSGLLAALSGTEITALEAYVNQIKDAGNKISVISTTADDLQVTATVYVDPLVIDITTGELIATPGFKPVDEAINNYINEENDLNFNGEFRRTFLIDAIQNAEGVIDPVVTSVKSRYGVIAYAEITEGVVPFSGYFTVDSLTITYKAYGT